MLRGRGCCRALLPAGTAAAKTNTIQSCEVSQTETLRVSRDVLKVFLSLGENLNFAELIHFSFIIMKNVRGAVVSTGSERVVGSNPCSRGLSVW